MHTRVDNVKKTLAETPFQEEPTTPRVWTKIR